MSYTPRTDEDDYVVPKVTGAPERIWLVMGEDEGQDVAFRDCDEVTWSAHREFNMDVKYVRADLLAARDAEVARLRKAVELALYILDCVAEDRDPAWFRKDRRDIRAALAQHTEPT